MEEYIAWLNSDRRHRELQYTIDVLLSKIRGNHASQREQGIEELARLLRCLKDDNLETFLVLQDIQEENVAFAVMKAIIDPSTERSSMTVNSLVGALDIVQGCCLMHHPTKQVIGIECRAIKLILTRIEAFCEANGGNITIKPESAGSSMRFKRRSSVLLDVATLDPQVVMACLDCLLALLVDHDLCQLEFKQKAGVAYIVDIIKAPHAPKEVRAKAAEFLLFLVRYFTEAKDDHQKQVALYLGEPLANALTECVHSTLKGIDKFIPFLKMVDEAK